MSSIDLISLKIQIVGGNLFKIPGYKFLMRSDQSVLLPKWFTHGGIILAKEQTGHSYFLIHAFLNILAQSQILSNSLYIYCALIWSSVLPRCFCTSLSIIMSSIYQDFAWYTEGLLMMVAGVIGKVIYPKYYRDRG